MKQERFRGNAVIAVTGVGWLLIQAPMVLVLIILAVLVLVVVFFRLPHEKRRALIELRHGRAPERDDSAD